MKYSAVNLKNQIKRHLDKISIDALPQFAQEPAKHVFDTVVPTERNNFRPHALRHRSLALISFLLVSVKIVTIAVVTFGPVLPALSSAITQANVVALTNNSRAAISLPALSMNAKLNAAAQTKANDMMARQYFSHITPDNKQPWDFIAAQGYAYQGAGENLGVGFLQAEGLNDAWMNSPGHRANILNGAFKEIGVGIASGMFQGKQATVVVQMFGVPMASATPPSQPTYSPAAPKPAPPVVPRLAPPVPVSQQTPPQPVKGVTSEVVPAKPAAPAPTSKPAPIQQPTPPPTATAPSVPAVDLQINKDKVQVTVETSAPADKVSAIYGNEIQELRPNPNTQTLWQGEVPVAMLTEGKYLNVRTEKEGTAPKEERLAVFENSFKNNYDLSGAPEPKLLSLFGFVVNPELMQNQFYLLMMALMLSLLVVAIGVRVHVQHLDLISNTAFVVTLATLLWYSGIQF